MLLKRLGTTDTWTTERGKLILSRPRPHVTIQRVEGFFESEFVAKMVLHMHGAQEDGYIPETFNDWELADNYASDVRIRLTDWTLRNRSTVTAIHNLVRSKLMAMGVAVANLALGNFMHTYTERTPFEEALRDACARPPVRSRSTRPPPV